MAFELHRIKHGRIRSNWRSRSSKTEVEQLYLESSSLFNGYFRPFLKNIQSSLTPSYVRIQWWSELNCVFRISPSCLIWPNKTVYLQQHAVRFLVLQQQQRRQFGQVQCAGAFSKHAMSWWQRGTTFCNSSRSGALAQIGKTLMVV